LACWGTIGNYGLDGWHQNFGSRVTINIVILNIEGPVCNMYDNLPIYCLLNGGNPLSTNQREKNIYGNYGLLGTIVDIHMLWVGSPGFVVEYAWYVRNKTS
jgi:hypothetical protein